MISNLNNNRRSILLKKPGGFALVATLLLMVVLLLLAVGLLSLSAIELRTSVPAGAQARAEANARMALALAIGELQRQVGDDRRITADASISGTAAQPNLVGVWESWSPEYSADPRRSAPNYSSEKSSRFKGWLVSPDGNGDIQKRDWADQAPQGNAIQLFSQQFDGFDLQAPYVDAPDGGFSWAVSQEGTKAKINVDGQESNSLSDPNAALQAQPRPSVALSSVLTQPVGGWARRAASVISLDQVDLDKALTGKGAPGNSIGKSYTTTSAGLLTDVVKGGLKVDLSLGFELSDGEFEASSWGDIKNPFRATAPGTTVTTPETYENQRPLFTPMKVDPLVPYLSTYPIETGKFLAHQFNIGGVPTFDHLRSFGRIPHYLYGNNPTVAARWGDHIATGEKKENSGNELRSPSLPPPGQSSSLSVLPVLNRVVFLISVMLDDEDQLRLLISPVIVMWNPYNTALEVEGMTAFPWLDFPIQVKSTIRPPTGKVKGPYGINVATMMGSPLKSDKSKGRSQHPYFVCEMTENGDGNTSQPIRFEAGELRVFAPTSTDVIDFESTDYRTVRLPMRAVNDAGQFNTRGGLSLTLRDAVAGTPVDKYLVKNGEKVDFLLADLRTTAGAGRFPYHINVEDATRIKDPNADYTTQGKAISEVQVRLFLSELPEITIPNLTYSELKNKAPVGVFETLHHVTKGIPGQQVSDLVYTTNSRQSTINHFLAAGSFNAAPHYQTTLRGSVTFSGVIQMAPGGRNSYWGESSDTEGRSILPFFEIPRQPLLSLAAFQQADLSSSTFATSYQFANSWASPYLALDSVAKEDKSKISAGVPVYDHSYLVNESLWDGFFFSGMAPVLAPGSVGNVATAWDSPNAQTVTSLETVVKEFVRSPSEHPLLNSRMRLNSRGFSNATLEQRLLAPEGCTLSASHLYVDGAFNINSTDLDAWTATLSGLRGTPFEVEGVGVGGEAATAFPRFRVPTGEKNDLWNGFRDLSDAQIRALATSMVDQVKQRGPFLSLAEFVNRRIENSTLGAKGAIQAAIDANNLNAATAQRTFSTANYPTEAQAHIINDTGVGIPGYLTQADVLQSLAPVITCRSDTFRIRAYGEAKDLSGKVVARAWCEAVVQRRPDFVDPGDLAEATTVNSDINKKFGRRFEIVSFRKLSPSEIKAS